MCVLFNEMVNIFSLFCLIELFFMCLYTVRRQIAVVQFLYALQLITLSFVKNEQQPSETRQLHCASSWQLMCKSLLHPFQYFERDARVNNNNCSHLTLL